MLMCRTYVAMKYFIVCLFIVERILAKITFNTYKAPISRVTPYKPYVIDKTCLLKPDVGPCRAEQPMYYYDPAMKNCSIFLWGGCQGNGNRFDTNYKCRSQCLNSPDGRRRRPRWCSLTFDYGFCFGALSRWYYDSLWKVCKERIYSGCGGNKNNFYNKEQCESICMFNQGVIKGERNGKDKIKKVLIINPAEASSKRGIDQITIGSANTTTNNYLNFV